MNLNYYILPDSLTIVYEGKVFHIANDSDRYKEAVVAIENNQKESLIGIIDPTARLGVEGFSVKDGLVHFKEEPLPAVIGNQLLKYKVEALPFVGLVNFWLNLKHRTDFFKAKDNVIKMLSQGAYPLTNDGFIIVYDNGLGGATLSTDTEFPFYSYGNLPYELREMFVKRMDLEKICQKTFGFHSKKLNKLVLERMINKERKSIDPSVFVYGEVFKGHLSNDNLFRVMENSSIYPFISNMLNLANQDLFLKNFTEKRLLNFFATEMTSEEASETINSFVECVNLYKKAIDGKVIIDLSKFKNFTAMRVYLREEITKLNHPLYELKQEEHFKKLKKIKEWNIDENLVLVLPKTSHDLLFWSQIMQNCIYDYAQGASKGQHLLLGVNDKTGKMLYNIEIRGGRIAQFTKSRNNGVNHELQKPVLDFLLKYGLIKLQQA